jgi:hypothetical protein
MQRLLNVIHSRITVLLKSFLPDPVPEEPELEPHDLLGDDERAPDGQVIADFR